METKHTKGIWETSTLGMYTNEGQTAILSGDKRICLVDVQNEKIKRKDLWNAPCEEREANAKLIAAAPELLEALIKLRRWAINKGIDIDGKLIIDTDNAINKATK